MTFNRTLGAVVGGLALISVAAGLKMTAGAGMIDDDLSSRIVQILIGLVLVVMANGAPKQIGRPRKSLEAEAKAQAARRIAGWALALAGLAYAAVWTVVPLALARPLSIAVVAVGLSLALFHAWRICRPEDGASNKASRPTS
ncbi:MAG TPA: hypothetical protein DGP25_00615 [Brevundimonas sp.]|nr:hypothetical protein [Brevundimonas sp.]